MSAISEGAPNLNVSPDSYRRYHTTIKVIVHSHLGGPYYLSDDVVSCSLSKNIKGAGRASLAVLPRRNWINLVYPNDIINIYFDIGDGNGWTRTFFGYIDRIEEQFSVADNGEVNTQYNIVATDFQKAIEKTSVYFNPWVENRAEFQGEDFAALNIGGTALRSRGIRVAGSPADIVTNLLLLQMGFGSQWSLPLNYNPNIRTSQDQRLRQQTAGRLINDLENTIAPEQLSRLRGLLESGDVSQLREDLQAGVPEAGDTALVESAPFDIPGAEEVASDPESTDLAEARTRVLADRRLRQEIYGEGLTSGQESFARSRLQQYFAIIDEQSDRQRSLLDVINLYDWVERRAIDGYMFDTNIWQRQGPLISIVRSVSNETINELFFDLRPVIAGETQMEAHAQWSRESDEIGENKASPEDGGIDGVRYEPAVIMREYPFSTIYSVDATNISVGLAEADGSPGNVGVLYFGAIFSNEPNRPGRHVIDIPLLNIEERVQNIRGNVGERGSAKKHLDVAVVSETEIRSTSLGRSDEDHFNLFEFYSSDVLGANAAQFCADFMPIITPIAIARHGLRVRSVSTRANRFSLQTVINNRGLPPLDSSVEEPAEEGQFRQVYGLPVGEDPGGSSQVISSPYGYRPANLGNDAVRAMLTSERNPNAATLASSFWHFHNGIDIKPTAAVGDGVIPITAIADGNVVASIPAGSRGFSLYGEYVVIEHPQLADRSPTGKLYSVYAHLSSRDPIVGNPGSSNRGNFQACIALGHHPRTNRRSSFEPIFVEKGTVIGFMGRSAGTRNNPDRLFTTTIPHLHFEINYAFPSKERATGDIYYNQAALDIRRRSGDRLIYVLDDIVPQEAGPPPNPDSGRSTDPQAFLESLGVDLPDRGGDPIDFEEGGGEQPPEPGADSPATESTPVPEDDQDRARSGSQTTLRGSVDSVSTRQQIGRWALLQDHWFQHNIEYLSGSVVMRGAPEIRVGYRLDILERDLSCYVESVSHQWQFPNAMKTTLQVTRGQPNNPYPAYALPPSAGFGAGNGPSRRATSRLAQYFVVGDPVSLRHSLAIRAATPQNAEWANRATSYGDANSFDDPGFWDQLEYSELPNALIPAESTNRGVDGEAALLGDDQPLVDENGSVIDRGVDIPEVNSTVPSSAEMDTGGITPIIDTGTA
jgi:murein DD-endopeptidase MepM/ murein hydrolase activator NlpD